MEGQGGGQTLETALDHGMADLEKGPVVNVGSRWSRCRSGSSTKTALAEGNRRHHDAGEHRDHDPQRVCLAGDDETSGILDYDWYNAFVSALNYFQWEYGAIHSTEIGFDISDRLMRWYEYEISVGPGERIVNTVTAPIYPDIDSRYEPLVFEYTYLLSPAQTWAAFGNLDIVVNTPYYMIRAAPKASSITTLGTS